MNNDFVLKHVADTVGLISFICLTSPISWSPLHNLFRQSSAFEGKPKNQKGWIFGKIPNLWSPSPHLRKIICRVLGTHQCMHVLVPFYSQIFETFPKIHPFGESSFPFRVFPSASNIWKEKTVTGRTVFILFEKAKCQGQICKDQFRVTPSLLFFSGIPQ